MAFCVWSSLAGFLLAGCSSEAPPNPKLQAARLALQTNQTQAAIDQLADLDSGEAHYLKAVALQRQKLQAAAVEEIQKALSFEVDNPRYQGFEVLLQLTGGKLDQAQKLIDLQQQHPSNGAVALFATPAYIARKDLPGAARAFDTALTLIDECPEFMFFALNHALVTEKFEAADRLLRKLKDAAPENAKFQRELLQYAVKGQRVEVAQELLAQIQKVDAEAEDLESLAVETALLTKQPEEAADIAAKQAQARPDDIPAQMRLAESLLRSPPSPENEQKLASLSTKFPDIPEFPGKHALYLTKHGRVEEAVQAINQGLDRTKIAEVKSQLLHLAVAIPLQAQKPDLAEQQINKYRSQFTSAEIVTYFEGRVAYLRRDEEGALRKFKQLVDRKESDTPVETSLTAESMIWVERILRAQLKRKQMEAAVRAVRESVPDKQEKSETAAETPVAPPVPPESKSAANALPSNST